MTAYEQGARAYLRRDWAGNPFKVGSDEYRQWDNGYADAEMGIA